MSTATTPIAVYLAGKIQKAHEAPNETYWTEQDQAIIRQALSPRDVHFLNPAIRSDDLEDQKSVFGRDMAQVFAADAVFVDARDRRGLGVGAEMMWAKVNKIPVVTLAPLETHYHKEETVLLGVPVKSWIHPFVEGLSDAVVESLEEGARWLAATMDSPNPEIKGPEWMHEAMHYYRETQFTKDEPMQHLAQSSAVIGRRLRTLQRDAHAVAPTFEL